MATLAWRHGTLVCLLCGQGAATVPEGSRQLASGARPLHAAKGWPCEHRGGALYAEPILSQTELAAPDQAPRRY